MIKNFSRSLESLLGAEYTSAVCRARAALTGESVPRSVREGEEILSGCINQNGLLEVEVKKAFGESTAMLAGDVLLTEAFEAVAGAPAPASVCVHAAQALGAGAGSRGMVYGQELDLKYEALAATEEQLRLIHRHKTGALINAAIQMGGAAAQADEVQRKALKAYAYGIGLVFQVVDDVLDVTGTAEQLGKPIGSDSENGKTTFVTLFGVDGAMQLAEKLNDETCTALRDAFGEKSAFLEQLARTLLNRRS